jgi:hypothetical protein
MLWQFPVDEGTPVEVRLYLMNGFSGTSQPGQRIFDIQLDGDTVVDGLDLSAEAGHEVATMRSFATVSDGSIDLEFIHRTENPLINGIEIIALDDTTPDPGELTATPTSLTFGEVEVGETGTATVEVVNTGGTAVTVAQVGIVGDQPELFTVIDGPVAPFELAPDASASVQVSFAPQTEGTFAAVLRLGHNGINGPLDIPLTGDGTQTPEPGFLTADPTSLAFGEVPVGESGTETVTLINSGEVPVVLDQVSFGGLDADRFALVGTPPSQVAAGGQATVDVSFAPAEAGEHTATLTITHDGVNTPLEIALSGTGVVDLAPGELIGGAGRVGVR